jgi:hydrogenase/urease accessory protein HupE
MMKMRNRTLQQWLKPIMRVLVVLSICFAGVAYAHEVTPAISDLTVENGKLTLKVDAPIEGFISGIDLTAVKDTNASPLAASYDALRALPPQQLEERFRTFWPEMAARMRMVADGTPLSASLSSIAVSDVPDVALPRQAIFVVSADVPANARQLVVGWDKAFGGLVVRQQGVEKPYTGLLEAGADSAPIALAGGGEVGAWQSFLDYIPVGFDHIVPKGLDHILFVLGLFFFSTRLKPLLWQVTAFTVAHTVTLALSSLGYVSVPGSIVEPLIAASIVFVAVENIWAKGELSPWRPAIVFGFGLLHGLGFASVLGEFGLPEGTFIPALIGFNIGVEFGQLAVIAAAAILFWTWCERQSWYRFAVVIPTSLLIAAIGAYWVVERTLM